MRYARRPQLFLRVKRSLTHPQAVEYLNSDKDIQEVEDQIEGARKGGVNGVPVLIIDGRWAISGGQTRDVYLQVNYLIPLVSDRLCSRDPLSTHHRPSRSSPTARVSSTTRAALNLLQRLSLQRSLRKRIPGLVAYPVLSPRNLFQSLDIVLSYCIPSYVTVSPHHRVNHTTCPWRVPRSYPTPLVIALKFAHAFLCISSSCFGMPLISFSSPVSSPMSSSGFSAFFFLGGCYFFLLAYMSSFFFS
jgi:hypothetical protein